MKNGLFLSLSLLLSLPATSSYCMEGAETSSSSGSSSSNSTSSTAEHDKPRVEEGEWKEKRYTQPETTSASEVKNAPRERATSPSRLAIHALQMNMSMDLLKALLKTESDPYAGFKNAVNDVNTTLHTALTQYHACIDSIFSTENLTVEGSRFGIEKGKFITAGDTLYEFLENPNHSADVANAYLNHPATTRIKRRLSAAYFEARKSEEKLSDPKIIKFSDAVDALRNSLAAIKMKDKTEKSKIPSHAPRTEYALPSIH